MVQRETEFSKEEIKMAEKHLKKCPQLAKLWNAQIKTTLRFLSYTSQIRQDKTKKQMTPHAGQNEGNTHSLLEEAQTYIVTMEISGVAPMEAEN